MQIDDNEALTIASAESLRRLLSSNIWLKDNFLKFLFPNRGRRDFAEATASPQIRLRFIYLRFKMTLQQTIGYSYTICLLYFVKNYSS